jgi:hypothetical protein
MLVWRRTIIRREEPKVQEATQDGQADRWLAWLPDPPDPNADFVFPRADLFYEGMFRPTVSPNGKTVSEDSIGIYTSF